MNHIFRERIIESSNKIAKFKSSDKFLRTLGKVSLEKMPNKVKDAFLDLVDLIENNKNKEIAIEAKYTMFNCEKLYPEAIELIRTE